MRVVEERGHRLGGADADPGDAPQAGDGGRLLRPPVQLLLDAPHLAGTTQPQTPDCVDFVTPPTKDVPDGLQFPAVDPQLPFDVTFGTSSTLENDQKAFDLFSWASFIALNWPADEKGNPLKGKIGDNASAPRVWETFITASQVFKAGGAAPDPWGADSSVARAAVPGRKKGQRVLMAPTKSALSDILQAGFGQVRFPPIADVNGAYVFYEIYLNKVEYDYLVSFKLYSKAGQTAFLQKPAPPNTVDFPKGSAGGAKRGSIEIKAAWKQLGAGDKKDKFYTINAFRVDPVTKKPSPEPLPFGLVGLHIVTRTERAPQWIWSTFEHVDNAPDVGEMIPPGRRYSFNDPGKPQNPAGFDFRPKTNDPVANPTTPTQITRVLNNKLINAPWTQNLNATMQGKLAGTVWANYRLVTTQWPAQGGQFVPCNVTNTVAETYIQSNGFAGSCMRCHRVAATAGVNKDNKQAPANFSYLLQMAQ